MDSERDSQTEEWRYDSSAQAGKDAGIFSFAYWQRLYADNSDGLIGCGAALGAMLFRHLGLLSFLLWIAGLLFSIRGLKKRPQWPAVVGICLSLIGIVILIAVIGLFALFFSFLF